MTQLLEVLDNALLQGLTYGIAIAGIALSLRILKYPDLTADGSFLLGACTFAATTYSGAHWSVAYLMSALVGCASGLLTAGLHFIVGVNRLLTGVLSTMILYSVAFRILGGRSNLSLTDTVGVFSVAESLDYRYAPAGTLLHPVSLLVTVGIAIMAWSGMSFLLRSDLGLLLRAIGGNGRLTSSLGRSVPIFTALGLAACNSLVGFTGALIASRQGFADVNMGTGVVIVLIAALIVGEECSRLVRLDPAASVFRRASAPFIGGVIYFLLYLLVLRASLLGLLPFVIQPTDLRVLSALVLVITIGLRAIRGKSDEELFPV